jgi:hypothetical protein
MIDLVNMINGREQRSEIERLVASFGWQLDRANWDALQDLFTARVRLDYTSLFGGSPEDLPAAELVARWREGLPTGQATQHLITGVLVGFRPEARTCRNRSCRVTSAQVTANVVSYRVSRDVLSPPVRVLGGWYDLRVRALPGRGWRIGALTLHTTWIALEETACLAAEAQASQ